MRILASIKHPNIISYKEAFFDEDSRSLCLIMEYAEGGDLFQRILHYQQKGVYMSESFIWSLIIQLSRALKALHELSILHRDLKSANVFLTSDGQVKLGDLNVSKVSKECIMHTQTGTPYYASPEVWKDIPYDYKSDMWSLGCVLYEAASLKPPFRAEDMEGLYRKVIKGEYQPLPRNFSADLQRVIAGLLQVSAGSRLNCNQILAMPAVLRHTNNSTTAIENLDHNLLQTIRFPKSLQMISKNLPEPNYIEKTPTANVVEPRPKRNKSNINPGFRNDSLLIRDSPEAKPKIGIARKNSEPLKLNKKYFLKENYKIIKLPHLRHPNKKYSINSLVQKEDIQSDIQRKPSTNRSFLLPVY